MTMNISTKKLLIIRFLTNPISLKTLNPNSLNSPTASSLSSSITPSIQTSIRNSNHAFLTHRRFSVFSEHNRPISNQDVPQKSQYVSPKLVSQVIDLIRKGKGECRSELDSMDIRLSKVSIFEIIRVLSCEKVLALQFFNWVRDNKPDLYRNGDLCGLMIDNCGWLNDYNTMRNLLQQFKHEEICLNENAFVFLPVLDSTKADSMKSISLLIDVLGEIGGSVSRSGVHALISMLCATDCFELANYVMEITEKKASYYAILVREKCKRGHIKHTYDIIKQMRVDGCEPDTKIYNYVLGSLCKNNKLNEALTLLEEMKQTGVEPDEITFEVFISSACRLGKMELANEIFDRLVNTGRVPRLLTYVAMIQGYFNSGRYEDAYAFVRDAEVKKMPQVHKMFSLLARLHRLNGNVDVAAQIIGEMMEKGLKPEFKSYVKVVNVLGIKGNKDLASDLKMKFGKFRVAQVD